MAIFYYLNASIIILLIFIVFFCRAKIGITFIMNNLVCSAFATIYFFSVPLIKITIFPINKKKDKAKKIRKKRDIKQLKVSLKILIKLFEKSLIVNDISIYVKEGTGSAFHTAVIYGLLWNVVGIIPHSVFTRYKVKNKKIDIESDFKEKVWKLKFNCIFSIKVVNIIFMCIELLKYILKIRKGGDNDVKSSDRRTNDNSYAKYQGNG